MVTTPSAATHPQHLSSILEMILHIDDLKPWSHRACDLAATKKIGIRGEVAEVTVRFYKGRSKVAARSAISHPTQSVVASLLSLHKRLAVTDFDR